MPAQMLTNLVPFGNSMKTVTRAWINLVLPILNVWFCFRCFLLVFFFLCIYNLLFSFLFFLGGLYELYNYYKKNKNAPQYKKWYIFIRILVCVFNISQHLPIKNADKDILHMVCIFLFFLEHFVDKCMFSR